MGIAIVKDHFEEHEYQAFAHRHFINGVGRGNGEQRNAQAPRRIQDQPRILARVDRRHAACKVTAAQALAEAVG